MLGLLIGFILAAGFGPSPAPASGADDFARGNTLYADGKYAEAASAYEARAHQGKYSANLFYNLADAYYRAGDRGRAILNYERALLLEPTHAEAAANLVFVRGRSPAPPVGGGLTGWLDVDGWTWLAAAGGWLAIIGLGAAAVRPRSRWTMLTAGLTGAVIAGISAWTVVRLDGGAKNPARAVVLADDTRALYSPADNSKAVLTLPAGGEVLVLSEQGAWDYVQLGDGSRGWVSADRVEKVIPSAARG